MIDTTAKIQKKMLLLMRRKSGLERLKMGADMFDMAKGLVLASLDCGNSDVRSGLFLRFYEMDFGVEDKEKILKHFGARHSATLPAGGHAGEM